METPLDSEMPICDAHHHLWERPPRDYLLRDLLADLASGHHIVSTVAIECGHGYWRDGPDEMKPVGETEFLEKLSTQAAGNPAIKTKIAAAIVGFADLTLGDGVARVLEAHLSVSPDRFRGIRHSTTWDASNALRSDAPAGMLADLKFREGFAWLKRFNLSFDAWLYHPQLAELADLACAFPDVTIILNHMGAPLGVGPYANKRDDVFRIWARGIAILGDCPNVFVKLGGLGSERSGYDWHKREIQPSSTELAQALKPYIDECIEQFGVSRCLFESNFPVEKRSNSYVALWNAFKRVTENYSAAERAALFHDTATRVYRIGARP
jgi:predicted TIM-barrel fold metal-dependent hydrolase